MNLGILRPYEKLSFSFSFFIIAFELILFVLHPKLPSLVPLWFSRPWSLNRLASSQMLYLIPASSLVILLTNNALANRLSQNSVLLAKTLSFISFLVSLIGLATLYQIFLIISP